jgi:hypothetical protein
MDTGPWKPRQTASLTGDLVVQPPDIHIIPPEIADGMNNSTPTVTTGVSSGTPPASGAMGATKGASSPDLIIMNQGGGGGLSLGGLLLLAGLSVGGWFLYKRFAK